MCVLCVCVCKFPQDMVTCTLAFWSCLFANELEKLSHSRKSYCIEVLSSTTQVSWHPLSTVDFFEFRPILISQLPQNDMHYGQYAICNKNYLQKQQMNICCGVAALGFTLKILFLPSQPLSSFSHFTLLDLYFLSQVGTFCQTQPTHKQDIRCFLNKGHASRLSIPSQVFQ